MSERIPSYDKLASIVAALQDFLVVYDRHKLFLADWSDPMIASVPTIAVRDSLCRLERLLNPQRLPYGSQELEGYVIAHWPLEVMTGLPVLRKHVYQIIERWDIPEVCDDRVLMTGNFLMVRDDGEKIHVNRFPPPHLLTARELERLLWVRDALGGGLTWACRTPREAPQASVSDTEEGTANNLSPLSGEKPPVADPTQKAVDMLGRSKRVIELIRFLAARENKAAELDVIISDIYKLKAKTDANRRKARKLAERARAALEKRGCPVRIYILLNNVRLIDAQPVA